MAKNDCDCKNVTHCEKSGSKYTNKWGAWPHGYITGLPKLLKWMWSMSMKHLSGVTDAHSNLPIYKPYFIETSQTNDGKNTNLKMTWLGHASVLLEIDGFTVLCDPVFSKRCGPYIGPARYRDAPCSVAELPKIDAVVISHNHYDHMDFTTINELSEEQDDIFWLIPEGDKANIEGMLTNSSNKIIEMKWWEYFEIPKSNDHKLKIVFTPTQHWSNRGLLDAFKSLWGSYAFIGPNNRFWFGGDTGYCGAFKEIGDNYGPFNGAAIPIGAYEPREFLKFQHVSPEEAVKIHHDIKSDVSIGIHWGTFVLSEEHYMAPKTDLEQCVKSNDIKFITINPGQTVEIKNKEPNIISATIKDEGQQQTDKSIASLFDSKSKSNSSSLNLNSKRRGSLKNTLNINTGNFMFNSTQKTKLFTGLTTERSTSYDETEIPINSDEQVRNTSSSSEILIENSNNINSHKYPMKIAECSKYSQNDIQAAACTNGNSKLIEQNSKYLTNDNEKETLSKNIEVSDFEENFIENPSISIDPINLNGETNHPNNSDIISIEPKLKQQKK